MKRPRPSVRLRLTLTYSVLFVVASAALLGISYLLVSQREGSGAAVTAITCQRLAAIQGPAATGAGSGNVHACPAPRVVVNRTAPGQVIPGPAQTTTPMQFQFKVARGLVVDGQNHALRTLLIESGVALGIMSVVSVGLGWLVAGRVLRPLHRITESARRASEETLHDRIALDGPDDELKVLADTFDAMLGRLEGAFDGQRRFVANASHELRTPLATDRILIDEALADSDATPDELRAILEQLRLNGQDTEHLIDALLLLARSQRGVQHPVRLDLADIAGEAASRAETLAASFQVDLQQHLGHAGVDADQGLLERMIGNLIDNALRHNHPGGSAAITTGRDDHGVYLRVTNSGPVVNPEALPGLVEPFRRYQADRLSSAGGHGLGLSIVDAVVSVHGGRLQLTAPADGGLDALVRF